LELLVASKAINCINLFKTESLDSGIAQLLATAEEREQYLHMPA